MNRLLLLLLACLLPVLGGCPSSSSSDDDDSASDDDDAVDDDDAADDDDAVDCGYTACGGDLVGTWGFSHSCPDVPPTNPISNCPGATYDVVFDFAGSMTFDSNGDFEQSGTQSADYDAHVPASCLTILNITTCDEVRDTVFGGVGTCAADGDDCDCTGPFLDETPIDATGTWTSNGSDWSVDLVNIGSVGGTYCVDGDTLRSHAAGAMTVLDRQ